MKTYLETYLLILKEFYNSNMVKLNTDKYQFMLSGRPKILDPLKSMTLTADNNAIKQQYSIKILGSIITPELSQERELSSFLPKLHNRINQFEKLAKYTDFRTRLQFMNVYANQI